MLLVTGTTKALSCFPLLEVALSQHFFTFPFISPPHGHFSLLLSSTSSCTLYAFFLPSIGTLIFSASFLLSILLLPHTLSQIYSSLLHSAFTIYFPSMLGLLRSLTLMLLPLTKGTATSPFFTFHSYIF